jgi:hypothetical protein
MFFSDIETQGANVTLECIYRGLLSYLIDMNKKRPGHKIRYYDMLSVTLKHHLCVI